MINRQANYLEKEVMQGSSLDHIILLYGKAINSLKVAKMAIDEGLTSPETVKKKAEALTKTVDILIYLQAILNLEKGGEIAQKLMEIYGILIDELIKVNFTNETQKIQDSIEILENLRKAWLDLKHKNSIEKPLNNVKPVEVQASQNT